MCVQSFHLDVDFFYYYYFIYKLKLAVLSSVTRHVRTQEGDCLKENKRIKKVLSTFWSDKSSEYYIRVECCHVNALLWFTSIVPCSYTCFLFSHFPATALFPFELHSCFLFHLLCPCIFRPSFLSVHCLVVSVFMCSLLVFFLCSSGRLKTLEIIQFCVCWTKCWVDRLRNIV